MMNRYSNLCRHVCLLLGLFVLVFGLSACSTNPKIDGRIADEAYFDQSNLIRDNPVALEENIYDPWEGFNRTMYRFNYRFDRYVFLPVVSGYQYVTPDIAQTGIHNFFNNIGEIPTFFNSVLQLGFSKSYQTLGRFVTNTTIGVLGLFDVATYFGIPRHKEDFGQTLGYWGAGDGPYLVLPILGPSSLRDGIGLVVDSYAMVELKDEADMKDGEELALSVLEAIDTRTHVPFRYYETGSPFEYELIRRLWSSKRQLEIEK